MKKTSVFLVSTLCVLAILFSSCLGDTKMSYSPDNAISYMTDKGYAISQSGQGLIYVSNDFLNSSSINPGKFYFLRYKLENPDNGINKVDGMGYGQFGSYPVQDVSEFKMQSPSDYETIGKNEFLGLTDFRPSFLIFSPYNLLNDKWIFQCTVSAYAEDLEVVRGVNNVRVNIAIQNKEPEKNNQAVMDVYLERINSDLAIDTSKQKTTAVFLVAVDLSLLRRYFDNKLSGEYSSEKFVTAYNQFQYYKYNTTSGGKNSFDDRKTSVGALSGETDIYPMFIGGKQPN